MADNINFTPDTPTSSTQSGQINFVPDDQSIAKEHALQEQYGTPEQQLKAGAEGLAKGIAGPVATAVETKVLGVKPEDIAGRAAANPVTHFGSEAVGLIGPTLTPGLGEVSQAGALGEVGHAVASGLGLEGAVGTAARMGVENALFTIGDEVSKALTNNPASIQTAAAQVGLSGLLGAGLGLGLGKVGELWKAKYGPEADSFVQDFSGRLKSHASDAIPTSDMIHEELANEFSAVEAAKSDLRGVEGLKAHELAQLMPQALEPEMVQQANSVLRAANDVLDRAAAEPGIYQGSRLPALRDYGARLSMSLADPELTPQKIFTSLDDFKKGLGSLKKWDTMMGETEKPAASLMGDLYHKVRTGLEDTDVWGKAGERQGAINKVFTEHIPAAKDFQRTFTERVEGEPVVSPGRISTLINGLGKPNAEIKLDKLKNYLEANDKLYSELNKIHENLGIENPYKRVDLINTKSILNNLSPGMKAADFVHKQAANAAAEAVSSGAGAIAGHMAGIPGGEYLGGLFGHYALKPFLKTVMPTLIRPLLHISPSGEGLKAALDGITAVAKGESLLVDSAKALFEVGSTKAINDLIPSKEQLNKLEANLSLLNSNPESILNVGGKLSHYMPEHATALTATAQAAVNYLNSQKPTEMQAGVLDRKLSPSPMAEANYRAALEVAESPLSVLARTKNGTLNPMHINHLKNLYPALFPNIVHTVTDAMLSHLSGDGTVPFSMRSGLSTLIGQPMDSTFTQPSIAAAQATFIPPQMPQAASGTKRGTSKLGKAAELHQTPSEARQKALNKA